MVKIVLLIAALLVGGCCADNRVRVEPGSKVDRQSQLYRDILLEVIRARQLEIEYQGYLKWLAQQGDNGVTNGTDFQGY